MAIRDTERFGEFIRVYIDLPNGVQYRNDKNLFTRSEAIEVANKQGKDFCRAYNKRKMNVRLVLLTRDRDGHAEILEQEIITITNK